MINKKHLKELKRKKKLGDRDQKIEAKKLLEKALLEKQERLEAEKQAEEIMRHAKVKKEEVSKDKARLVLNYVSDKNGCGYYRSIFPFELVTTYVPNTMVLNSMLTLTDPEILRLVRTIRFQRHATREQRFAFEMYEKLRKTTGYPYMLQYEMDDLLMDIDPSNKIAYDFFNEERKNHHLYMMRNSDRVSFSTDALRDVYVRQFDIDPAKAKVIKNHLPQFLYQFPGRPQKDFTMEKPRIFWSGSASHIGKGGDLDFLLPLIEKTVDKYKWVFQGVIPEDLKMYVEAGKIEFIPWAPIYGLANVQFYLGRPDIILAPLKPSIFNQCKSDLKYLESCALGAPCVCTSFMGTPHKSPYEGVAQICVEPNVEMWEASIEYLVNNPQHYAEVVKKQREYLQGRWMEVKDNLIQWFDLVFRWPDGTLGANEEIVSQPNPQPKEQLVAR
jgi:hypothetical protein